MRISTSIHVAAKGIISFFFYGRIIFHGIHSVLGFTKVEIASYILKPFFSKKKNLTIYSRKDIL